MEKVKKEVAPVQKIKTVDYQAWQVSNFQISKALTSTVINILQEKLKIDIIKACYDPYQNPCYLVKKSTSGKY